MPANRNYFQKFPTISYNDYVIRDLSVRTKMTRYIMETGIALLPYTIKEDERADSIASFYYEDPYYAWAIYLANGIIDPYSEWPKDYDTFNEYIDKTYGGFEHAIDTIVRYESNWAEDTTLLTPEAYELLKPEEKKYWQPQFGYNAETLTYFRRPIDAVILNNRIDQLTVIASNNKIASLDSLILDERMYQYNFANDLAVKCTLVCVDSTEAANTQIFRYTNATFYDIKFNSASNSIFLRSTANILPRANVSGTGIPSGTYVVSVANGNYLTLSKATTAGVSATNYTFSNPASAVITVNKVDFSDTTFASNGTYAAPNSFFTYIKNMDTDESTNAVFTAAYRDINNTLVGRRSNTSMIVLDHRRLDDPGDRANTNPELVAQSMAKNPANALLANSSLSNEELKYWKSVNAYEDEQQKNEARKEIFVLDALMINRLDEELEKLLGNV